MYNPTGLPDELMGFILYNHTDNPIERINELYDIDARRNFYLDSSKLPNEKKWCEKCEKWVDIKYFRIGSKFCSRQKSNNKSNSDKTKINKREYRKRKYNNRILKTKKVRLAINNHLEKQKKRLLHLFDSSNDKYFRGRFIYMRRNYEIPNISHLCCYYCGKDADQWHHVCGYDIEYIAAIIPVCKRCHRARHRL